MNKTIVMAVLSGVLAGGILVSAGSIMADTKDSGQRTKPSVLEMKRGGMRGFGDGGPGFMNKTRGGMAEEKFDQLVTEGVISEDQAVKIKEFITAKAEEKKAEMEKLRAMTEDERKAFFEENKDRLYKDMNRGINIFDEMVDEGIISQDQAEKLAERKPGPGNFKKRYCDPLFQEQE